MTAMCLTMAIEEKWKRMASDGLKNEQGAKRGRDTFKDFYYTQQNNFISKIFSLREKRCNHMYPAERCFYFLR